MKKKDKKLRFIVEKTVDGFSAYSQDYPIYTAGNTLSELKKGALEASNLYFSSSSKTHSMVSIHLEIDLKQFFLYYRVINAKFLAMRIGMNPTLLSQYIKGHKHPSQKQQTRILTGIREIGIELSELSLL